MPGIFSSSPIRCHYVCQKTDSDTGWTFVVRGGMYGLYLWIEKFLIDRTHKKLPPRFIYAILTFFLINITWVFFRATDFTNAWNILKAMFYVYPVGKIVLGYLSFLR